MIQGSNDTVASEWPGAKMALMDLVSNVIMHPENEMEWFAEWCRAHRRAVIAVADLAGG
jgi:hypothetical protein